MSKQFTPEEAEAEITRIRKIMDDRGVAYQRETISRGEVGAIAHTAESMLMAEIKRQTSVCETFKHNDEWQNGRLDGLILAFRLVFGRAP